MSELLIFGGTTEGRQLAEFCAANGIPCGISVATVYGASLLPARVRIHTGRLDCAGMQALMTGGGYTAVVDATHPYAAEATANIRRACELTRLPYERLVRRSEELSGEVVRSMEALITRLNECDAVILSTLGSKSLPDLTQVRRFRARVWVRMLPAEEMLAQAKALGFARAHIIGEQGPFTTAQNIAHIRQSGAGILVTKESGAVGGYPEKIAAAKRCGIRVITLARPNENGRSLAEIEEALMHLPYGLETEGII